MAYGQKPWENVTFEWGTLPRCTEVLAIIMSRNAVNAGLNFAH